MVTKNLFKAALLAAAVLSFPVKVSADDGAGVKQSRNLVVYFSRTGEQYGVGVISRGNTAVVAEMIAGETGADMFEVKPQKDEYPATYKELTDYAKKELFENARPAIAGTLPDLSGYDTVYIGAPVWWGDWPMIMYTFFEAECAQMEGKRIMPFATHAGSGLSGFDRKLSEACGKASVGAGLAVTGADAQKDPESVKTAVRSWLGR